MPVQGFPCFSIAKTPPIEREIRDLIRHMTRENPTWGAPRIISELALLGHDVAKQTVAKYMVRTWNSPSQTWRTGFAIFHNTIRVEVVLPASRQPWPNDRRPAIGRLMVREGFLVRFFRHRKLAAPTGLLSYA